MRTPRLCYHKGSRKWYVTLDREVYLSKPMARGKGPPIQVRQAYDQAVGAWLAARATMPVPVRTDPTVADLWAGYQAVIELRVTAAELSCTRAACEAAVRLFGSTAARHFGPRALADVRAELAAAGGKRKYVNAQAARVRRMFKWAAAQELVPATVWQALRSVEGLRAGELGLAESAPVRQVPDEVIDATLPFLESAAADLVRFHRLVGCRADEACEATTAQFERLPDPDSPTGETWRFTPAQSKNQAYYWVGPKAQVIISPRLRSTEPEAWLFPARPHHRGRGCLTRLAYLCRIKSAVTRANAERAKEGLPPLPHWTPLQIRHRAAEEARASHPKGLEAVQARLRHKHMSVSEIYAHELDELGRDVARRMG